MLDRPSELIRALQLEPHPEGGHYREIYRSTSRVEPGDGRGTRAALTSIYYLLERGQQSCLHRVTSDEVWHFYQGGRLDLICVRADFGVVTRTCLGSLPDGGVPTAVIPSGYWQAAQPLDAYALVGCTVGPGFEFDDFTMLRDDPDAVALLELREPSLRTLL